MTGKTLVHEFHISYSHIQWYFLFLLGEVVLLWLKIRLSKLNCNNNNFTAFSSRLFLRFHRVKVVRPADGSGPTYPNVYTPGAGNDIPNVMADENFSS